MKKIANILVGLFMLLMIAQSTYGQTVQTFKTKSNISGWDRVSFGMTLGQVIKQYPNAFKDSTTTCIEGIIQIQTPVKFDEHICNVSFYFVNSKLESVTIIFYTDFDTLESEFIARYGGQKRQQKWDRYKPLIQTTWTSDTGKITMMPNYIQFSKI